MRHTQDGYQNGQLIPALIHTFPLLPMLFRSGKGWQRALRRGVHTLTRPQYQLMYVQSDEPYPPHERTAMKLIRASEEVRP